VTVHRILSSLALCLLLQGIVMGQDDKASKPGTFFAGTVVEATPDQITIARVIRGKTEKRVFRVTKDTKVEGKLRTKVRVTVRYLSDEDGDVAIRIVVRAAQPKPRP
jgi:hypothetical protein